MTDERNAAGSPLPHNSHVGDFEPGDGQNGDWPRERLAKMDERFHWRLERATARGKEHAVPMREPARRRTHMHI
jgi:hypothetical protein